jgi:hypothetical protein
VLPELNAYIDATEQEIPRHKNKKKRKTIYSGKKKKHTVKTRLTVNSKGLIVHKSAHVSGSIHDYRLFKHRPPVCQNRFIGRGIWAIWVYMRIFWGLILRFRLSERVPGVVSGVLRRSRCHRSRGRLIRRWRLSGWFLSIAIVGLKSFRYGAVSLGIGSGTMIS